MRDPIKPPRRSISTLVRSAQASVLLWICSSMGCRLEQCETTADCVAHQLPGTICTPRKYCAKLVSDDCPRVLGGEITPGAQVFALMTKLTGQSSSLGSSSTRAAELALSELSEWSKGVRLPADKHPANLRILSCNDGKDSADAVRIARRLVDGLGIPAIMGPVYSGVSLDVARLVTIPAGALMLNPYTVTPLLTALDDDHLVWRTSLSNKPEGAGMWQLVELIHKALSSDGRLAPKERLRIATVARPDVYGHGIIEPFITESRRSSLGTVDPMTQTSQLDVHSYELVQDKATGDFSFDVGQITGPAGAMGRLPHIIVLAGTAEVVKTVIEPLELARAQLPSQPAGTPIYIASEGVYLEAARLSVAKQGGSSPLRNRFFVFAQAINRNLYSTLTQRWETRYKDQNTDVYGIATTYDAVYLLAYSMAALGRFPVTGANLQSGIRLLTPDQGRKRIPAGLIGIELALGEMVAGRGFDYDGVSGPLDFDLSGDTPGDFDVLCVRDENHFAPSGMTLKGGSSGVLSGAYAPCP